MLHPGCSECSSYPIPLVNEVTAKNDYNNYAGKSKITDPFINQLNNASLKHTEITRQGATVVCSVGHQWIVNRESPVLECKLCQCRPQTVDEYVQQREGKFIMVDEKECTFTCKYGHSWNDNAENVLTYSTWCSRCIKYKYEQLTISIAEKLFDRKFVKTRDIIVNPKTKRGLEFDGYSDVDGVKIAIEYNGIQHYQYVHHFHRGNNYAFANQVDRDNMKERLCVSNNIKLIVVSYENDTFDSILDCLKTQAITLGLEHCIKPVDKLEFESVVSTHSTNVSTTYQKALETISLKGGRCINNGYATTRDGILVQCAIPHHPAFIISVDSIVRKDRARWCRECVHRPKVILNDIELLLSQVGGTYISHVKHKGSKDTNVTYKCVNGHECTSTIGNLRRAITENSLTKGCNQCRGLVGIKHINKIQPERTNQNSTKIVEVMTQFHRNLVTIDGIPLKIDVTDFIDKKGFEPFTLKCNHGEFPDTQIKNIKYLILPCTKCSENIVRPFQLVDTNNRLNNLVGRLNWYHKRIESVSNFPKVRNVTREYVINRASAFNIDMDGNPIYNFDAILQCPTGIDDVSVHCTIHNKTFTITVDRLLNGQTGCKKCRKLRTIKYCI